MLRIIVALKLSFANVSNVEFWRIFCCLNNTITFSSSFIIKNHLILRAQKIQSIFLKNLFDDIKIFLSMNCWSFFNHQEYFAVNAYFIDEKWNYHEVLLMFEHMTNFHTKTKLTKIMRNIIARHKLKERIYAIINDNARNNFIMHEELVRLLRTRLFNDVIVRDINILSRARHSINFEKSAW